MRRQRPTRHEHQHGDPQCLIRPPPHHQSGGLAGALAKLNLDALTVTDAVAATGGENVTTALRADIKELGGSIQSLQREIATLRWMIGIGFTLLRDVDAGSFVFQCKLRRGLPSHLREWLRGITAAGARKNAIGIVVWKAPREKDDYKIVVLRLCCG